MYEEENIFGLHQFEWQYREFCETSKVLFQFQTDWEIELVHVKDLVKQAIPFYQLDAPFVAFYQPT